MSNMQYRHVMEIDMRWLPGLGSNQGFQLQRLTCCHYTTGQFAGLREDAPRLYSDTDTLCRQVVRGRRCFGRQEPLKDESGSRLVH